MHWLSAFAALTIPAFTALAGDRDLPEPQVPTIRQSHRAFLSRVARRTVRDRILQRDTYEPGYVPEALAEIEGEVIVRLRQRGYLRGTAAAGPGPVVPATRNAALSAADMLIGQEDADLDLVNELLIEIEVVGPPQALDFEGDWTMPRAVDRMIEPGVHGLVLLGERINHRFAPTELFTTGLILADALKRLAQSSHATPADIINVKLMRFRTLHWYDNGHDIVSLHRGLSIVPPDAVTATGLDKAIAALAEYMSYRRLDSGLFTYQYEPGRDRYSDKQNVVRQAGAAAAMAVYAAYSGKDTFAAAADASIRYHLQGLTPLPGFDQTSFIATGDGRNKLGVTALVALAMAQHPASSKYDATRQKLVRGMLALQQSTGMFLTAFPPTVQINAQEYFPGEALLALAAHYEHSPSGEILDAFHKALSFYRAYFRDRPSPAFVPWQVQAYAAVARHTGRRDYAEYVFELTDWLAQAQLTADNCPWAELWGGIAAHSRGRVGVATAAYLEGFADALDLARRLGDMERAARYERLVRGAARFVMQLQFRPEEAYFVPSPQDAVGGIRTSPSLNLLRIDHCQHALIALIKTRQALYPKQD